MRQYQQQGQRELAAQIAMQVLRLSRAGQQLNTVTRLVSTSGGLVNIVDSGDANRTQALSVLASSGRLSELVDRAKAELKKTPNSANIHQALADYYTAARRRGEARAELIKVAELRPDDVNLRIQIAGQLAADNQTDLALKFYKDAYQKDPALGARLFYEVGNLLERDRKYAELFDFLEQIDLRVLGTPTAIARLIEGLPADAKLAERIRALYRKCWQTFPGERYYLIGLVRRDEVWQMPEMYDFARSVVIPQAQRRAPIEAWYPFQRVVSRPIVTSPTTTATTAASVSAAEPTILRFIALAESKDRLAELAAEVEAARKAVPSWIAGDAIRVLLYCRLGKYQEARAILPKLFDELDKASDAPLPMYGFYALWTIGAELEKHAAVRELAASVYEHSLSGNFAIRQFRIQADEIPLHRLVDFWVRNGRDEQARAAILKLARSKKHPETATEETIKIDRLAALPILAGELVKLGYPVDAVPLYHEALALAEAPDTGALPRGLVSVVRSSQQIRDDLDRAVGTMARAELAAFAGRQIADAGTSEGEKTGDGDKAAAPRDQVLDLVTLIHPRELDAANVRSLLAESIAACDANETAALAEPLSGLHRAHPDDFSVSIAMALAALATSDPRRIEPALAQLSALVEQTPLEPLSPGTRANARQRTEAARQVPLWLVARVCARAPPRACVRRAIAWPPCAGSG